MFKRIKRTSLILGITVKVIPNIKEALFILLNIVTPPQKIC